MRNIESIKDKYLGKGIREDNLSYAIEAVKEGSKREHIIENLTADYRGMPADEASQLLEELFAANGGEFKKENRGGYLYGAFFLLIGLSATFYIYYVFTYGGVLIKPILVWAAAILCSFTGVTFIIKAIAGKYRDGKDDPFENDF